MLNTKVWFPSVRSRKGTHALTQIQRYRSSHHTKEGFPSLIRWVTFDLYFLLPRSHTRTGMSAVLIRFTDQQHQAYPSVAALRNPKRDMRCCKNCVSRVSQEFLKKISRLFCRGNTWTAYCQCELRCATSKQAHVHLKSSNSYARDCRANHEYRTTSVRNIHRLFFLNLIADPHHDYLISGQAHVVPVRKSL